MCYRSIQSLYLLENLHLLVRQSDKYNEALFELMSFSCDRLPTSFKWVMDSLTMTVFLPLPFHNNFTGQDVCIKLVAINGQLCFIVLLLHLSPVSACFVPEVLKWVPVWAAVNFFPCCIPRCQMTSNGGQSLTPPPPKKKRYGLNLDRFQWALRPLPPLFMMQSHNRQQLGGVVKCCPLFFWWCTQIAFCKLHLQED